MSTIVVRIKVHVHTHIHFHVNHDHVKMSVEREIVPEKVSYDSPLSRVIYPDSEVTTYQLQVQSHMHVHMHFTPGA